MLRNCKISLPGPLGLVHDVPVCRSCSYSDSLLLHLLLLLHRLLLLLLQQQVVWFSSTRRCFGLYVFK